MASSLERDFFQSADEQYDVIVNRLSAEESQSWEHGEIEQYIHQHGTELLRRLLQGHLDLRYSQEGYETEV